jgi:hypothetical protein
VTPRALATEAGVLGVFLLGALVSRSLRRRWHGSEIATMYALGLLFEVLTAHMWTYHHIFLVFPFAVDRDISILFPLGWAGLIMTATPLAERVWERRRLTGRAARHLALAAVWLAVGGASEIAFYTAGMIEYVRTDATRVNFALGQLPHLPPTLVLLGYGLLQPFASHFFHWMEKGLRTR